MKEIIRYKKYKKNILENNLSLWEGDVLELLNSLPNKKIFDLVITSPPYNIGKEYEEKKSLEEYFSFQEKIIRKICSRLKNTGSICWQVGNYVSKSEIYPLDFGFHEIFKKYGLNLNNRIIWKFGHGLHSSKRFTGRYEVILWYSKSKDYVWNLDSVRVPQKYPGKKAYQGPKKGSLSGNPLGKNPEDFWEFTEDVWDIPNVKGNHVEKTEHPCQFPVALVERLIKSLSNKDQLVFDPFMGVGSSGVAAVLNNRNFLGAELNSKFIKISEKRLKDSILGKVKIRKDVPVYDHKRSNLSNLPENFKNKK